jgi:hypothetical protein
MVFKVFQTCPRKSLKDSEKRLNNAAGNGIFKLWGRRRVLLPIPKASIAKGNAVNPSP